MKLTQDELEKLMPAKWAIRSLVDRGIARATVEQIRQACDVVIGPCEAARIVCLGYEEFRSENDEPFTVVS
jgi:hypothetical protein